MIGRIAVLRGSQVDDIRGRLKRVGEALGCDEIRTAVFAAKICDSLRSSLDGADATEGTYLEIAMDLGAGLPRLSATVVAGERIQSTLSLPIDPAVAAGHERGGLDAARTILAEKSRVELLTEIQEQNEALLERGAALEAALRNAEAATEAKSTFLASMSHELRTPLNSILGFTRRLKKRLQETVSERELDALITIERNGRHLLSLINDILDLSKIEAGRMELALENVSLVPLLEEVVAQCEPLIAADRQKLRLETSGEAGVVHADVTKIRQIVMNLVSNAIKYSEEGPVEVEVERRTDDALGEVFAIAVRDHGDGMTAEQIGQLFERFARLDTDATRKVGGTGLGLTISAKYAAMHGGRIDVASTVGVGSVFTLILPAGAGRDRQSQSEDRLLVLCADLDEAFLDAAQRLLRQSAVEVVTVRDRPTVIALAKEHPPDVICLGPELADLRPELERCLKGRVPIVEMSGRTPQMSPMKLREAVGDMRESIQRTLGAQLSKVLIVEDNPDARELLVSAFEEIGTPAFVATTGEQALQYLADEEIPSAILLDLMLPGLSGFDVARFVRSTERLASIPIVVVSAMQLSSVQLARMETFADAVLEKGEGVIGRAIDATLAATAGKQRIGQPASGQRGSKRQRESR